MASSDNRTDACLLRATRLGDADAFGVFFARHGEPVLVFLRRRCPGAELAADLTAETSAAALLAVHRGTAEHVIESAPWLFGIDGRDALLQRVLLERDYDQIAARCASTPSAIRKRVGRGLARLRHQMGEAS